MYNMTDIRSYTNGQPSAHGVATSHARGGGDFLNALQDAVKQNPVSAALIGMGVLWMFSGGSNTSLFGGAGRKSIMRMPRTAAAQLDSAVRETATRAESGVAQAANAAVETASHVADSVREATDAIGEGASRTAGLAADAVASAYDATTHAASRTVDTISNAARDAAQALHETGNKWGGTVHQNIADIFERQPLLLGAIGIAIGAGIAASIPATDVENRVMGQASDTLREVVSGKTAEIKEMADAALDEARAQGLTPVASGNALRMIRDKAGAAAGTTP
jgi:hypothetical protein